VNQLDAFEGNPDFVQGIATIVERV